MRLSHKMLARPLRWWPRSSALIAHESYICAQGDAAANRAGSSGASVTFPVFRRNLLVTIIMPNNDLSLWL